MVTPLSVNGRISFSSGARRVMACAMLMLGSAASAAAAPPMIRTDADNAVPRCVTPKKLMAFIRTRNRDLDPRFADIASYYKKHGQTWNVRWDYAFFQMVVETNFLTYKRGDGRWGDVDPKQNNFAGLGTTGGGVPGDSYPDVGTGVLAQIQHLVVYSGQRIDEPVGARTRLKQDDILSVMAEKKGRTTFADLARRWAADRHYGASIEWVANNFRQSFCTGREPLEQTEAAPAPSKPLKRAVAKQEMAHAANLGGPTPAEISPAETSAPETAAPVSKATETKAARAAPVRTIWAASDSPTATPTAAAPAPIVGVADEAPLPARKPTVTASAGAEAIIETEQIIQTGETSPAGETVALAGSESAAPAVAPQVELPAPEAESATSAPLAESPPARTAFAFAAAMSTAQAAAKPAARATTSGGCRVTTASYGGKKALLVRSGAAPAVRYTVLTVLEGFEASMLGNYLKAHAPEGSSVGEFPSKDAALAKARELCPSAAGAPRGEAASAG